MIQLIGRFPGHPKQSLTTNLVPHSAAGRISAEDGIMQSKHLRLSLFCCVTLIGLSVVGNAQSESPLIKVGGYQEIAIPGAVQWSGNGVNNSGAIVGGYVDTKGVTHGFLVSGGTVTTLDYGHGFPGTNLVGINSNGVIVGCAFNVAGICAQGVLYKAGQFTAVGPTGSIWASGINDSEEMVGTYVDKSGVLHGWRGTVGNYTTLDVFTSKFNCGGNACPTALTGINNKGWITAFTFGANNHNDAFLNTGKWKKIDVKKNQTIPYQINNNGDVALTWCDASVGNNYCWTNAASRHGALYQFSTKKFTTFDVTGGLGTSGSGINDTLELTGYYYPANSVVFHGFKAQAQ